MSDAVLGEFGSPDDLVRAIAAMRDAGCEQLNAYTPYPVDEVEEALGLERSRLPLVCCAAGLVGALTGYLLQWLLEAQLYPLNVGGRPPHFPLAFLIITFEMGVLAAALTAFFGVLVKARLPRLWDRVDEIDGFENASRDRYWLAIEGRAAVEALEQTKHRLEELAPRRVVTIVSGDVR